LAGSAIGASASLLLVAVVVVGIIGVLMSS